MTEVDDGLSRLARTLGAPLLPPIAPSEVRAHHIAEVRADLAATGLGDVALELACGVVEALDLERPLADQRQRRARLVVAAAWNARRAIPGALEPRTLAPAQIAAVRALALARGDAPLMAACAAVDRGDGAARWVVAGAWNAEGP